MNRSKYRAIARIGATDQIHHFSNLSGRALTLVFRIWIFSALYTATYKATGSVQIGGLTVQQVVWLLVFTQSFRGSGYPPPCRLIDEEVKSGTLAYSINRPYHYPLFHLSAFYGRVITSLAFNVTASVVAAVILVGPIAITLQSALAALVLLTFSYLLDFVLMFPIGMLAFWVEDTQAFQWIYYKGQLVFGGLILPLSLFPEHIRSVAERLPFAATYYSAARLMVHYDPSLFVQYLVTQGAWIVVGVALTALLYLRGIRRVELNGG